MGWTARDARSLGVGLAYLLPSFVLFAIRKSAYNEGPSKEWATKYPVFLTAVNQIRDAPQNRKSNGAVLGVFAQARAHTQKMIESVLLGQSTSQKALDDAVADMNAQIDKYNKANK